jgi:Ca2+-binding EF-hand superfamily protein
MDRFSTRAFSIAGFAIVMLSIHSSPAAAADGERCAQGSTSTRDVEGDGHLTSSAHQAAAAKRFEIIDTNKDGKVTADEIGASRGAESIAWAGKMTSAEEKIADLDTNKDGALTPKEYADSSQKVFIRLDVDRDGVLSDSEMLNASNAGAR